jgi:hypothetical protein
MDRRPIDRIIQALRDAASEEITIGIARDRKESTVTAKVEGPRRPVRGARPA